MPELGWVKLNLDGAFRGNPGVSGAGGIIRDHFSQVILAYYESLGFSTNMMTKLQGMLRGIQLCFERSLFHVWVEVDAMHVIQLISKQSKGTWHLQTLLIKIRKHLSLLEGKLTHIFREGNQAADFLAKLGCLVDALTIRNNDQLQHKITGIVKLDRFCFP
ncbi:UNVERIFIED_CONTAM: putative ribonuclease H protein [Sesamum angustifolium]|uniref:Ribonuclease H protein n=1 Tax=Sesamum angustifolium TaxID=2727405 RepID=A0AAW2IN89_9LAMI